MQIENLKATLKKRPYLALAVAAVFHLSLTLSVFAVGRSGVLPQQFDGDGIGDFASDGHTHKAVMDSLVGVLKQGEVGSWIDSREALHVKLFSLAGLATEPLVGSNILTIEPLNLLYYLAILVLTFILTRLVAGGRAAWLAALIVGLWPSLLLHTTQFLRDPLIIIATLMVATVLVVIFKQDLNWRSATGTVVTGGAAIYLTWQTRQEMGLVIAAIIFVAALLLLIKIAVTRKIIVANLLALIFVVALSIGLPRAVRGVVRRPLPDAGASTERVEAKPTPAIWGQVASKREWFIIKSQGSASAIDDTVFFNSYTDVFKYVPRALEIGYFAPFPSLWFGEGNTVGVIGRILSGFEMTLTYIFETLACFFVWQTRRRFSSWLLAIATLPGMLALGLVVTNVGTLYRMRYPFWILIVIMAAGLLGTFRGLVRKEPMGSG